MSKDVKMIAALMDDDLQGENLLDAARNLCAAFYDLLKAAEPETKEVRTFYLKKKNPSESRVLPLNKSPLLKHKIYFILGGFISI